MGRAVSLAVIFLLSFVVATVLAPPDAFSYLLTGVVVFVCGVICFILGVHEGAKYSRTPGGGSDDIEPPTDNS